MNPFKRILVPVDFSIHSDEAIRYASDLARRYEATLTVLHVYQLVAHALPDGYVLYTPRQLSSMMEVFDQQLARARANAVDAGATQVETRLVSGVTFPEIVAFAEAHACDLIVMGTHGRTGIQHALLGSVAEKVVRKAPCPVLTVRAPQPTGRSS